MSFTNGLKVESWDQAFSFKIGGRILVDGGVNSYPVEAFVTLPPFPVGLAPFFPAHAGTGFSNQVGIRQARLQVEGTAFKWWDYKLQYEFAGSPNGLIVGGIRDAYLAWRYFAPLTFQVGNFYEPFSLERINSDLYRDFIERPLPAICSLQVATSVWQRPSAGSHRAFMATPIGALKGGIFSTSVEDGNPVGPTTKRRRPS